jgi:hypothetical protein
LNKAKVLAQALLAAVARVPGFVFLALFTTGAAAAARLMDRLWRRSASEDEGTQNIQKLRGYHELAKVRRAAETPQLCCLISGISHAQSTLLLARERRSTCSLPRCDRRSTTPRPGTPHARPDSAPLPLARDSRRRDHATRGARAHMGAPQEAVERAHAADVAGEAERAHRLYSKGLEIIQEALALKVMSLGLNTDNVSVACSHASACVSLPACAAAGRPSCPLRTAAQGGDPWTGRGPVYGGAMGTLHRQQRAQLLSRASAAHLRRRRR